MFTPRHPSPLVIFDGVCAACNRLVNFVMRKDHQKSLYFTSNTSVLAAELLEKHALKRFAQDSIIVIDGDRALTRSEAVLFIASKMGGTYGILAALGRSIPKRFRDWLYSLVAPLRFKILGKVSECSLIDESQKARIL